MRLFLGAHHFMKFTENLYFIYHNCDHITKSKHWLVGREDVGR